MQRLPALELFVGFDSNEIAYLEAKVLNYLRESMRGFFDKIKKQPGSDWV